MTKKSYVSVYIIMAIILAIESSGTACGTALTIDGRPAGEYAVYGNNLHDRLLAELVRRLIDDVGLAFDRIDALAVSSGPGSFTGLRIGASLAKGICFEGHPKLIAVPTLSALAFARCHSAKLLGFNRIACLAHSHKDLYYRQLFDADGKEISAIELIPKSQALSLAIDTYICSTEAGEGFPLQNCDIETDIFSARHIAQKGSEMYDKSQFTDPDEFVPNYGQEFKPKII